METRCGSCDNVVSEEKIAECPDCEMMICDDCVLDHDKVCPPAA